MAQSASSLELSKPSGGCCACATAGHAADTPISAMNSRRFISASQCRADTTGSSRLDKDVGEKAGLKSEMGQKRRFEFRGVISGLPHQLRLRWHVSNVP